MAEVTKNAAKIKIKLIRSVICAPERPDDASFRGMVKKIPHLLAVVE
jgi:ribosomal protein L30/L7E